MTFPARHISVSINRPAEETYGFAMRPENMPKWAAGLGSGLQKAKKGEEWIVASPMGKLKVVFTPKNIFGILDHTVTFPSGRRVYNPVRVFSNSEGSEVVFTLYRLPDMTDQEFTDDAEAVKKDLQKLKTLMKTQFLRLQNYRLLTIDTVACGQAEWCV